MKKTLLTAALVAAALSAGAQAYEVRTLTFEDSDYKASDVNFAGKMDWSSLIDEPQYGGPMLYPKDFDEDEGDLVYWWYDEGNTEVYSELTNAYGDGAFWAGGIAISNYVDADLANGDNQHQLAVPTSSGSSNFAVVYCNSNSTISEYNPQTELTIVDGKYHVIESMRIGPTLYQLAVAKGGNGYAKALTAVGDYLTLSIHGMVDEDIVATVKVDLARDGEYLEDWTTIDLTPLGEVNGLMFTMDTNDKSYGYACQPTYFAFDDMKIRFDAEPTGEGVATFEDLTLEDESYWNGSDMTGSFISGGFQFENGFEVNDYGEYGIFEYAYGFFYSNQTSTEYNGGTSSEQYNSAVGHGAENSDNYAVYNLNNYANKGINVVGEPRQISGCYLTNNAYAYSSMTEGDYYAKQFTNGDWLKLTIIGLDADGEQTGTVDFYLADLRSDDPDEHYILNEWRWCDLTALGEVSRLEFAMSSSDNGDWGMNTPAYFCMDNLDGEKPADTPTAIAARTADTAISGRFSLSGMQVGQGQRGLQIVRMADGQVRKVFNK